MSRHASIIATYRLNQHEVVQAQVSIAASFPDAMNEAKVTALSMVHEILDEVYSRERVPTEPDPT